MKLKNIWKHLRVITKHRWIVFKLCVKAGIPIRGLFHDLSKYSPTEFFEGVRFYRGNRSPNGIAKKEQGFSRSWLHHKGRNKHHHEYWYDYDSPNQTPMMPYKYVVEMICDNISAGVIYQGKNWTKEYQLTYWNRNRDKLKIDNKLKLLLDDVYNKLSSDGIDSVIKKEYTKEIYRKYNALK